MVSQQQAAFRAIAFFVVLALCAGLPVLVLTLPMESGASDGMLVAWMFVVGALAFAAGITLSLLAARRQGFLQALRWAARLWLILGCAFAVLDILSGWWFSGGGLSLANLASASLAVEPDTLGGIVVALALGFGLTTRGGDLLVRMFGDARGLPSRELPVNEVPVAVGSGDSLRAGASSVAAQAVLLALVVLVSRPWAIPLVAFMASTYLWSRYALRPARGLMSRFVVVVSPVLVIATERFVARAGVPAMLLSVLWLVVFSAGVLSKPDTGAPIAS